MHMAVLKLMYLPVTWPSYDVLCLFAFQQVVEVRRDARSKDRKLLTAQQQVLSRNTLHLLSLTFCVNNHYSIFIHTATKQGPADPRQGPADPRQ